MAHRNDDVLHDDNVQHGIDDNPNGDAGKGALLGGLGGAAVGAVAGGPVGAIVGAVAGAIGSGAAVAAVDTVDNDDTISGIGTGATGDVNAPHTVNPNEPSVADQILGNTNTHQRATAQGAPVMNAQDKNLDADARHVANDVTDRDTIRVPIVEEELNVQKTMQQAGEVQVHKDVVTEQVSVPVEVSHEEVVVTRHAVDRELAPGETAMGDETIRVPVMEERVDVNKTAHVVEEIEIGKRRTTEQQTVSDTVRKEVVDVDDTTVKTDKRNL